MAQSQILSGARLAVLKWQVVETDPLGNRWVIAAFDAPEHAEAFAESVGKYSTAVYEVRVDPQRAERAA